MQGAITAKVEGRGMKQQEGVGEWQRGREAPEAGVGPSALGVLVRLGWTVAAGAGIYGGERLEYLQ